MEPTGRVRGRANIGWKIVQLGRIASPSISSNAILVSIVFRDTDIRWKSRRVFPDCKTLMPRTARSNVALSMLHRG